MSQSVAISRDALVDELRGLSGTSIVTITSRTTPRMRKTGNPYVNEETREIEVRKVSRVNGMIGFVYANSVNNQRAREAAPPTEDGPTTSLEHFEPQPRQWGERLEGTPLVEHKGRFYLELKVERVLSTRYETVDGEPIDYEDIEEFLYTSSGPGRQGVDNPVILRDYRMDSIQEMRWRGSTWDLID